MARPKKKHAKAQVVAQKQRVQPKEGVLGKFAVSAGRQVGTKAVGVIVANPFVALITISIALILMVIISYFAVVSFMDKILNPWIWALAFIISIGLRPSRTSNLILSGVFTGGVFWIYETWVAYQAVADVCAIPIIGMLICGAYTTAWLFNLVIYILTGFVMITAISYLRKALLNI